MERPGSTVILLSNHQNWPVRRCMGGRDVECGCVLGVFFLMEMKAGAFLGAFWSVLVFL